MAKPFADIRTCRNAKNRMATGSRGTGVFA